MQNNNENQEFLDDIKVKDIKPKKAKKPKEKKSLIGGQALLEGVMMRSGSSMAMAVRDDDGTILIDSKRLKSGKRWYKKVPVIRGIVSFFASLVQSVGTLSKSAEVLLKEDEKQQMQNKKAKKQKVQKLDKNGNPKKSAGMSILMGLSMILGLLIGVGLFFAIPFVAAYFLEAPLEGALGSGGRLILVTALIEGGIRIAIFVGYMALMSVMRDIRRMFAYHGAEHRTISCFEKGMPLTVENVQKCSTRHNRCGTTFMFFVMIIAILVFSLVRWATYALGLRQDDFSGVVWFMIRFGINMAFLPLVAGLSFELLRLLAILPQNWTTWIFRAPGLALQRLSTFVPDDEMAEVALAAFVEVQEMDENIEMSNITFGQFRYKKLREMVDEKLAEVNAEPCETDWIFVEVAGYKRNELDKLNILTHVQYKRIAEIVFKRTGKPFTNKRQQLHFVGPQVEFSPKPLSQAMGYTEFYGEKVLVNSNVLTPRQDTEILVQQAIGAIERKMEKSKTGEVSVLDLCTGSGCIALALSKNTNANIVASDICDKALAVAKKNLENRKLVEVIKSDLLAGLDGRKFDVIVSNPPYIPANDINDLDHEVKNCEPLKALDGGIDGLDFYRRIATDIKNYLNLNGVVLLEVGINQATNVKRLFEKDYKNISIIKDLNGIDRVVVIK